MKSKLPSPKIRDIRGERFGRLVVESLSHISPDKGRNAYWLCTCDCGKSHTVSSSSLRTKTCISCGCYKNEVSKRIIKELHNTGKHLYFISCPPYIKIGRANKPKLRLGQIRASNPFGADLLYVLEDKGYCEKAAHAFFSKFHHTGEWFLITKDQVECFLKHLKGC